MTLEELKKQLNNISENLDNNIEMKVSVNGYISPIENIDIVYDMNTNIPALTIEGYNKYKFKEIFY